MTGILNIHVYDMGIKNDYILHFKIKYSLQIAE